MLVLALVIAAWWLPHMGQQKHWFEKQASTALKRAVRIGQITAELGLSGPRMKLSNVIIADDLQQFPVIAIEQIYVSINLIKSLVSWQLFPDKVQLHKARFTIERRKDGSFGIPGIDAAKEPPFWLLKGQFYTMVESELRIEDRLDQFPSVDLRRVNAGLVRIDSALPNHFYLKTLLPKHLGYAIDIRLAFDEKLLEPQQAKGQAYLKGNELVLTEWRKFIDLKELDLNSGLADLRLWSEIDQGQIKSMSGQIAGQKLSLVRHRKKEIVLEQLGSWFKWQSKEFGWELNLNRLQFSNSLYQWPDSSFNLVFNHQTETSESDWQVNGSFIDLTALSQFLLQTDLLTKEQRKILEAINPQGQLTEFSVAKNKGKDSYIDACGQFSHITFSPHEKIPGIANLSGKACGSDAAGHLSLAGESLILNHPKLFQKQIPINHYQADFWWERKENDWEIISGPIGLTNDFIATTSLLNIKKTVIQDDTFLDIQTHFEHGQASMVASYLPIGIMRQKVVNWLQGAFKGGEVSTGDAIFFGKLHDYPFLQGKGVFEVLFSTKDMHLNYSDDWPMMTEVAADVRFYNKSMQVDINQGKISGATIKQATATIPQLGEDSKIEIHGNIFGKIEQSFDFLGSSPLKPQIEPILRVIDPSGNNDITLHLDIPLKDQSDELRREATLVNGTVNLQQGLLTVKPINLLVNNIRGILSFDKQGVFAERLVGHALGSPIEAQIEKKFDEKLLWFNGEASIEELKTQFPSRIWDNLQGKAKYSIVHSIPDDSSKPQILKMNSDLHGISSELPGVFSKTAKQRKNLDASLDFSDDERLPVHISLGSQLRAGLNFSRSKNRFISGRVALGKGKIKPKPKRGLEVDIDVSKLYLDDWLQGNFSASTSRGLPDFINGIHIKTKRMFRAGKSWGPLNLQMVRQRKQWQGSIDSRLMKGTIWFPTKFLDTSIIHLELQNLYLNRWQRLAKSNLLQDTKKIPGIDITSQSVQWNSTELGQLELFIRSNKPSAGNSQLVLGSEFAKLELAGSWSKVNNEITSHINGQLNFLDLGKFLQGNNISKLIEDTPANFDFSLDFLGAPQEYGLEKLTGKIQANLGEGRLRDVNPGIGRILGLFDLNAWYRRIRLDFSDLYAEGLTYDSIIGTIEFEAGLAETDNMVINAVPAKIEIKGLADLLAKQLQHKVIVTPKTTLLLPLAGGLAGGPVVGAAVLAAQQLVGDQVDGLTTLEYDVVGDWKNPKIKRSYINDGALQKLWTWTTDFRWLNSQSK